MCFTTPHGILPELALEREQTGGNSPLKLKLTKFQMTKKLNIGIPFGKIHRYGRSRVGEVEIRDLIEWTGSIQHAGT
jgi:hypothetical protein